MEANRTDPPQERVTSVAPLIAPEVKKTKDPKKVEAGRRGAQTRKAKHERLLGELRADKEQLRSPDVVGPVVGPAVKQSISSHGTLAGRTKSSAKEPPSSTKGNYDGGWKTGVLLAGAGVLGLLYLISKQSYSSQEQTPPVVAPPVTGVGCYKAVCKANIKRPTTPPRCHWGRSAIKQ